METTRAINKGNNEFGIINKLFSTTNEHKSFPSVNDDEIINNL